MLDWIFRGVFDTGLTAVVAPFTFLLCIGVSLLLGLQLCAMTMWRARSSGSFAVTLALLPAVVELHYVDAELFRARKLFFHEALAERRVAAPVAPCVRHGEEPSGAAEDLRVVPFPQSCEFIGFPDADSRAIERERI